MTKGRASWLALGALMMVPILAVLVIGLSDASRAPGASPSASAAAIASEPVSAPAPAPLDGPIASAERVARSDPERSRALLREALERSPNDDALMQPLAQKLLNDENHREARELVLRCLETNPKNRGCQEIRRHVLEPRKIHDDTTPFLKNCLERDPTSEPCLAARVVEAVRNGDQPKAEDAAGALRAAHPESTLAQLADGRVLSLAGDYAGARERFEKACEGGQAYGCYRAQSLREEGW